MPFLGPARVRGLPGIPIARSAIRLTSKSHQEPDEVDVLRMLETLASESAGAIVRLELTRAVIAVASAELRWDNPAQGTLLSILGGTRYRYAIHGVLVPTRCPTRRMEENATKKTPSSTYSRSMRSSLRYERAPMQLAFWFSWLLNRLSGFPHRECPPLRSVVDSHDPQFSDHIRGKRGVDTSESETQNCEKKK